MPDHKLPETKRFSIVNRAESFSYAFRGLWIFLKSTHNAWVHLTALAVALLLGFYFHITQAQWLSLVLVSGLVFVAEALNTTLEIDVNLTSPNYHPYARDMKDVAAGAVLIAAFTALVVGLIIFVPYIVVLFT